MKTNSRKVVRPSQLPSKLPIEFTLIVVLIIKVFEISGVALGLVIAFMVIVWIINIMGMGVDKYTDVAFRDQTESSLGNKVIDYKALVDELRRMQRK